MVVKIVLDRVGLFELLRSPTGAVARDAKRRGNRVQEVARLLAPKRTGRLAASIGVKLVVRRGGIAVEVGTELDYAWYQHEGTGIYGRGHPIRPRAGKVLVFMIGGHKVYAHQVRGAPPTKFLERAIFAAL